MDDAEKDDIYLVVVNAEEQYSIWPRWKAIPPGWRSVQIEGNQTRCLEYIETVWTDMRPASLRRRMDGER